MEIVETQPKIWSNILQEVRQTRRKLPANKSILVLGDYETGKTSLIAKLAGLEAHKKGSGLEYKFIEVRDEYRDDSTKLGVWTLHGDVANTRLLNFALTEENFENSSCVLVASMSEPWNIMRSLETWAEVFENHIRSININQSKLERCQQQLQMRFFEYLSASDDAESKLVSGLSSSLDEKGKVSALAKNLGIDITVVITKTDYISTLEREHDYTEETFDFIQQAIRKFCLRFGAALIYVSVKLNKNCDLLLKYLANRVYDLPFKTQASIVERDAIFVPAGWDNERKISILYDNIRNVNPDDNYEDFIQEMTIAGPAQRDVEIVMESDQDFLLRMQNELCHQATPAISGTSAHVQARQNLPNPIDTKPASEGTLQIFFNSLLSKGITMPPSGYQDGS